MALGLWSNFSPPFLPFASTKKFHLNIASSPPSSKLCHHHFTYSHLNSSSSQSQVSPPTISDKTLNEIENSGVIACLRAQSAELALEAARVALDVGITVGRGGEVTCYVMIRAGVVVGKGDFELQSGLFETSILQLEIVMSTPGGLEVVKQLAHEYPRRTIGVGTILHLNDAKHAINSGAKFLLSPAMVKEVLDYASHTDAVYIPGVMTPTEILCAFNAGARMVKVYPISALGGIKYIAALKKPFPHIPMVASQGIDLDSIEEYIAHGATSVVLSDAIFCKKAMSERNFKVIHQLSHIATSRAKDALGRLHTT